MRVLVVSCSLNPTSRSAQLAESSLRALQALEIDPDFVDLRVHALPLCDGGSVYADPRVIDVQQRGTLADAVILAVPIYNYDVNAAAKNLIELSGRSWSGKPVGFMCCAGGKGSFMSVMSLANSLMLDFRCHILPRFVYTTSEDFTEQGPTPVIADRIGALCLQLSQLTQALAVVTTQATPTSASIGSI